MSREKVLNELPSRDKRFTTLILLMNLLMSLFVNQEHVCLIKKSSQGINEYKENMSSFSKILSCNKRLD